MKKKESILKFLLVAICLFFLTACSNNMSGNNGGRNNYNVDIIDNIQENAKIVYWEPKKTFTVTNVAEINITSLVATERINPPKTNSVYSYMQDQAGETYILAKGNFKNLLRNSFDDWKNFDGKLIYDGNYEYNVYAMFATNSDNDFYRDPTPLQSLNAYFYASVPSELIKTSKPFTLQLQFVDDNGVNSDIYEYSFIFNN